ncbi:helix-turn-helix domain-containing protein [Desulfosarcina sp. OttesenSCG-928-A07]|nr:helix-turn-helix domain-containing protein [Desulfosarcina sp. OttesenSCG-928-G17]MDL2328407.1 helix-turn-helix domain-containing protein [Desulfosarcina sp. OttesenSCG-928-A07]
MGWYTFGPYVSVAQKKAKAEKLIKKLKKQRPDLQPVCLTGRSISTSFWGKAWCKHLETYADHENRIGRGRSYVRNSAVCHLEAAAGSLKAIVAGSSGEAYDVAITVRPLPESQLKSIKSASAGRIGSMLDLLSGKFPKDIMVQVADPENGLFPRLGELKFSCSCPDWAQMCKHVAATLYAFGHRLDLAPELLFLLRDVDPAELVNLEAMAESAVAGAESALGDAVLVDIFGIELDLDGSGKSSAKKGTTKTPRKKLKAATTEKAAGSPNPSRLKAAPAPKPIFKNSDRPKGREISALRQRLNLTAAEFAAALGVSPVTVSRWENLKVPALQQKSKDKLNALVNIESKRGVLISVP